MAESGCEKIKISKAWKLGLIENIVMDLMA